MNIYCEFNKLYNKNSGGINVDTKNYETLNTTITNVEITNEIVSKKLDKDIGSYSTIFCEEYNYLTNENFDFLTSLLTNEINKILNKAINKANLKFFVVGLGNGDITADSLGVRVVNKIISTSLNINNGSLSNKNFGDVFSLAPSVASKNGMYTLSVIKSIVNELKPDIVIVVDSLSCKNIKYMCKTFQVNNCGLTPGCEIDNKQPKINYEELNIPVLSVGSPVVTNAKNITRKFNEDLIITLKDIDIIINKLADVIAFSLNKVIHKNLKDEEIIFLSKN